MLKTFRVFSRAVNKRGYTVGITQNVKAVNMQAAIDSVISNSGKAGLSHVIIAAVHELKGGGINEGNYLTRNCGKSVAG